MQNLWNDQKAAECRDDPLKLRVYTSRLLGQEPDLVLHGGGNTSVKALVTNLFGETEDVLCVKGSGWDLATIEAAGFAPVKMDVLKKMAELNQLTDEEMVSVQRSAMTDPNAPNPSVEAILHAIIPFHYVDHTHADAVVTVTNTPKGEQRVRELYGDRVIVVPYVMPGFILAKKVYEMTRDLDWNSCEGIILMNHGIFTFANSAKESYDRMIRLVTEAENYLKENGAEVSANQVEAQENLLELACLRREVSLARGGAVVAKVDADAEHVSFSDLQNVSSIATRGPLTPDHVIRTKRIPLIVERGPKDNVSRFTKAYQKYFARHTDGRLTPLDPAPRWAVWPGHGIISFGRSIKEVDIISDITTHTIAAIERAEALGGWKALPEKEIFEIEYWVLEQAKLKKAAAPLPLQGKVALVTGAASGIGRACVESLNAQGAAVMALDINTDITTQFHQPGILGLVCDVTDEHSVKTALESTVREFGGLDILVSNAGTFPASERIAEMKPETWSRSLNVNLTSHEIVLQQSIPFLELGIDPAVVIIASKNVPAPGAGVSAYSVAKAGLTQLGRVAALELGSSGIRVNMIHPNAVFDTAIWTKDVLEKRAKNYGMSVEEYKTNNLLKREVSSKDVADLVCSIAGPAFSKTTGAQVPIDGGNDRVI